MSDIEVLEPEVPALAPTYAPSWTVEEFILATAAGPQNEMRLLILEGPRGEGKTTGGIWAYQALAERLVSEGRTNVLPVRVGLVRDTFQNIQRCLALDSLVLTPTGWIKAGDVSVGDRLVAGDGSLTRVAGVYQRSPEMLWRVQFSDGSAARVTDDHLWVVQGWWDRARAGIRNRRCSRDGARPHENGRLVTTAWLRQRLKRSRCAQPAWSLPLVAPVEFPKRPVPIDPYLLGVLLGDGGFSQSGVRLSTADLEIVDRVRAILPSGLTIKRVAGSRYDYQISGRRCQRNQVIDGLRTLGLFGLTSPGKFIPDCYLWNDPETRLRVLRGIMDTDGHVSQHRHCGFSSTSERLVEGVEFLVRSLGGLTRRAKATPKMTTHVYRGHQISHRHVSTYLTIQMTPGVVPFELTRKVERARKRTRRRHRFIVGIEPVEVAPSVCFKVEHPSGLFVIDDFVVTHNTTLDAFRQAQAKGVPIEFLDQSREAMISGEDGRKLVHVFFFGLDNKQDTDKLQGFQCGILHLEEVAPAASMSAGIPAEALGLGATSVRQEGVPRRILVTMNSPDEDHWIVNVEQELTQRGLKNVLVKRFLIPPNEKAEHFRAMAVEAKDTAEETGWIEAAEAFESYRDISRAFLESIGRGDLVTRLISGQRGMVQEGEVCVSTYSRALHRAQHPLQIYPNLPIVRGWDAGLTPSTVWLQPTPRGNLNVLGSRLTVNGGMEQHILTQVIPFERKYGLTAPHGTGGRGFGRGERSGFTFRDIGDPACTGGNQTKSEETVAWLIEDMLSTHFEPGPVEWSARREALNAAFSRKGDGDRMFILLDPDETKSKDNSSNLEIALNGRFHYPKHEATGRIIGTIEAAKRVSGIFAQEVDALGYVLARLHPAQEWLRRKMRDQAPKTPAGPPPRSYMGI